MASRRTTLVMGYMRRMTQVAKWAREMSDIKDTYNREFGEDIEDQLTTAGLAMALRRLGVVGPDRPQEVTGAITEPPDDAALASPGPPQAPTLADGGVPTWE